MEDAADRQLLERLAGILASGLKTQTEPFPEDSAQIDMIVGELRQVKRDDLEKLLVIAGVVDHPCEGMRCFECMYYLPHRKWCALPEIDLPVQPNWWCRLWRI